MGAYAANVTVFYSGFVCCYLFIADIVKKIVKNTHKNKKTLVKS
jgi:hypothetical protein